MLPKRVQLQQKLVIRIVSGSYFDSSRIARLCRTPVSPKDFTSPYSLVSNVGIFAVLFVFKALSFFIPGSKLGGSGGGDWLGLSGGDDDGGLDLSSAPLKTSTPFPQESRKDTPSVKGTL